jgi:NADH-quinone oxidoreductase subunit M
MLRAAFIEYALCVLVVILRVGFIFSLAIPAGHVALVRFFAFGVSVCALIVGLAIAFSFDKSFDGFQHLAGIEVSSEYNLNFTRGLDGVSLLFVMLTLFIFPLCFLAA